MPGLGFLKLQKKSPAEYSDRGHFYFVAEGQSYFAERGHIFPPTGVNLHRLFHFAVIQSEKAIPLKDFINSLIKLGVSDALYLDMGTGWNYGWYRPTKCDDPTILFDYRTPYQTNWLLIKGK